MNIITTNKKWEEVLSGTGLKILVNALDVCRQQTGFPAGAKNQAQPCSLLFYGTDDEKIKAAAALTGQHTGQPVYRVDLSAITSDYIGDTEKNIALVFEQANTANQVLFFDEADGLFNKRSDVKDGHNRNANQAIEYLMQQIRQYRNPVIVALTNKQQVAAAVLRSFTTVIHFPATGKD